MQDKFIWPLSIKGSITFKDAFSFFNNFQELNWVKQLWQSFVPPRVSCTAWKILNGKIPTHDQMQKRGFILASRCELCKSNGESSSHVFIHCQFTSLLWKWLWQTFNINTSIPNSPMEIWKMVIAHKASPQVRHLLISGCLLCFHIAWEARNNAIFRSTKSIPSKTIQHFKCWLKDIASIAPSHMSNNVQDLTILHRINVSGVHSPSPSPSPKITEVLWSPPHPSSVKVNTDGLALGAPGQAAIGGVFRNWRGFPIGSFCKHIGIKTAFNAELEAYMMAIDIAWKKGWRNLWVELDSQTVANCVQTMGYEPPWIYYAQWSTCVFQMQRMQLYISHIYREGNQVADKLSHIGLQHKCLKWWNSHPTELNHLIAHDYAGQPSYRFK